MVAQPLSRSISRVLSCVIIYLRPNSQMASSDILLKHSKRAVYALCFVNLASDGVYMATFVTKGTVRSYRAFPPLPKNRRFISVALSLRSPSPGFLRRPCSMMLGLSSLTFFHTPPRLHNRLINIVLIRALFVNKK